MVIIATKDLCPNAWELWTVSCAIWHSLKCCQSLWIYFRVGHCSLPSHEDNILHVLGDKKSRLSVKWFNVSCLYFFSDRFSPNTMCLTLYISNRGQNMRGLIPVCTFFPLQLCGNKKMSFSNAVFSIQLYEDIWSSLPVLTVTSLHSSRLNGDLWTQLWINKPRPTK